MKSLVLADIHANLAALEAIFQSENRWDEILFLGDAIIGGPQPDEMPSLLGTFEGVFLMDNHDWEVLDIDLARTETDPHRRWKQWTRRQLSTAIFAEYSAQYTELWILIGHAHIQLRNFSPLRQAGFHQA